MRAGSKRTYLACTQLLQSVRYSAYRSIPGLLHTHNNTAYPAAIMSPVAITTLRKGCTKLRA